MLGRIELLQVRIREWVATGEIESSAVVRNEVHDLDLRISLLVNSLLRE
jgi:hypothetical protein